MLLYCPNGPFILFNPVEESRLKFGIQKEQPLQVRRRSAAHSTFINYENLVTSIELFGTGLKVRRNVSEIEFILKQLI